MEPAIFVFHPLIPRKTQIFDIKELGGTSLILLVHIPPSPITRSKKPALPSAPSSPEQRGHSLQLSPGAGLQP